MKKNIANIKRTYDLHYDEVVIGCNLSALLISHKLQIPFIYTVLDVPDKFVKIEDYNMKDMWTKMYTCNSLIGLNLFGEVNRVTIEDNNSMTIKTKETQTYNITFNKVYICDPQNVEGLKLKTVKAKKYEVVDTFHITSSGKEIVPLIKDKTKNRFIHTINIKYVGKRKIAEAYSTLTHDEIYNSIDFNENMARFKVLSMLKESGMTGRTSNNQFGKKIKRTIQMKHLSRSEKLITRNKYESTETVKIITQDPLELFTAIKQKRKRKYWWYYNMIYGGEELDVIREFKQKEYSSERV